MEQYHGNCGNYVSICLKIKFFNSCKNSKIIPKGLVVEKNLATGVNDELFVKYFQTSLNEASSRGFDKVIERYEYNNLSLKKNLRKLQKLWV